MSLFPLAPEAIQASGFRFFCTSVANSIKNTILHNRNRKRLIKLERTLINLLAVSFSTTKIRQVFEPEKYFDEKDDLLTRMICNIIFSIQSMHCIQKIIFMNNFFKNCIFTN